MLRALSALLRGKRPLQCARWVWGASLECALALRPGAECAWDAVLEDVRAWVARERAGAGPPQGPAPPVPPTPLAPLAPRARLLAARVALGDALERRVCAHWEALQAPVPRERREHAATETRLLFQSYAAALWTSAHAHHLQLEQSLPVELQLPELLLPEPRPSSVPSQDSEGRVANLLDARAFSQASTPKGARNMAQELLMRCVNPATRGWSAAVNGATRAPSAARALLERSLLCSLTALHPSIEPPARRSWAVRAAVLAEARAALQAEHDCAPHLQACTNAVKETLRRTLAGLMTSNCATRSAASFVGSPAGRLVSSPLNAPSAGLRDAVRRLHEAGLGLTCARERTSLGAALCVAFKEVPAAHLLRDRRPPARATVVGVAGPSVQELDADADAQQALGGEESDESDGDADGEANGWADGSDTQAAPPAPKRARKAVPASDTYNTAWIGRSKQRAVPKRLVDRVRACFYDCFKANFLPFWMVASTLNGRPQRLDEAQYEAAQQTSAAARLCQALTEQDRLEILRLVLQRPAASMYSLEQVANLLGFSAGPVRPERPLSVHGARNCARLLEFSRVAWALEHIPVVDLGERTRRLQVFSLTRRYGEAPRWAELCEAVRDPLRAEEGFGAAEREVRSMPVQLTNLCCCVECTRVCNLMPQLRRTPEGSDFDEVGVSRVNVLHAPGGLERLYCSQRSSAALRTAIETQARAAERKVDLSICETLRDVELGSDAPDDAPRDAGDPGPSAFALPAALEGLQAIAHDGNVASRMRRDCKRVVEQRACPKVCGHEELLTVDLLGRAARVFGAWYTLCAYCGSIMQLDARTRVGVDPCCLCCRDMEPVDDQDLQNKHACRFCGVPEPARGARFACYHSPLDRGGLNRQADSALRFTRWCTKHDRPWLSRCLQVLGTNMIFAHIMMAVAPGFDEEHELRDMRTVHERERGRDEHHGRRGHHGHHRRRKL